MYHFISHLHKTCNEWRVHPRSQWPFGWRLNIIAVYRNKQWVGWQKYAFISFISDHAITKNGFNPWRIETVKSKKFILTTDVQIRWGVEAHLCDLLVHSDAKRFHLHQGEHPGVLLHLAHPLILRVLRLVQKPLPNTGQVYNLHNPLPRHCRELLPVA